MGRGTGTAQGLAAGAGWVGALAGVKPPAARRVVAASQGQQQPQRRGGHSRGLLPRPHVGGRWGWLLGAFSLKQQDPQLLLLPLLAMA